MINSASGDDLSAGQQRILEELRDENLVLRDYVQTMGYLPLAGEIPLDSLLQQIVETAGRLLKARYAALGVFDDDAKVARFFVAGFDAESFSAGLPFPRGEGLLGYIVKERRIVRVARIREHPASVGFPAGHPTMTSFLGGPIEHNGVIYGNLYLTDRVGGTEFSAADEELLAIFARQSAMAIENAKRFDRLQVERSSLEAIFDSLRDAVFTTDLDDRIVRLNRRASEWAGGTAVGQTVKSVFDLVDGLSTPISTEGEAVTAEESTLVLRDGRRIPVEHVMSPIRDAGGRVLGTVQVLRDLRPQREVEQLKANIISLVSHELRTPLSHIKGYASTMLQPDVQWDAATQRDFIAGIDRQADRLARLISDLLEVSRLDAGGAARLDRAAVAPQSLVERGIRQASATTGDRQITATFGPDVPLVYADPSHIERVLTNLIENAAKYSNEGQPIQISVVADGDEVIFAVEDRGPGLTAEEQSHLFERFYRSPRVKHRTPGTGLGLAICQEIIHAHEGRIWAENSEGRGAVFRFSLPRFPHL